MVGIAGRNVRQIEWSHRTTARTYWGAAAVTAVLATGLSYLIWESLPFLFLCLLMGGGLTYSFIQKGMATHELARLADQGAIAEEEIGLLLRGLPRNWHVEFGHKVNGVGDIDVIIKSPKGITWAIDVKSHRGTVFAENHLLFRRMGKSIHPFRRDYVACAKRQAELLAGSRNLSFVHPVLVFTNAKIDLKDYKFRKVAILQKHELIPYLMGKL